MNQRGPILTFRASVRSDASPAEIYDALSDLRTHLVWAGEEAPKRTFRLLSMEAAAHRATVGERFASSGANIVGTFHDRSVVVESTPDSRFGFDTDSTLERKHTKALQARFTHRYAIEPSADGGAVLTYVCEAFPVSYVPWWLRPGMRSMTRFNVQRLMTAHLRNLVRMTETEALRPA
jgi:hypothetical protein